MSMANKTVHDFTVDSIEGKATSLKEYAGKVLVIVNTATKCGLAGQFEELETIYQTYKDQGLVILGFPSNQFMNQEPGSNEEVKEACQIGFGVTFPLFAKIDVNGDQESPLYTFLKSKKKGVLGSNIKWNFTKFVIDGNGRVVKRFGPKDSPSKMIPLLKEQLALLAQ